MVEQLVDRALSDCSWDDWQPRESTVGREPVAIVQNATRDDMAVLETTLAHAPADIVDSGIGAPSIVCIGRVVQMRQCLDWMGQLAGEPVRDTDPLGMRTIPDTA